MTKTEAIKKIEKLTGLRLHSKLFGKVYYFTSKTLKQSLLKITKNKFELYDENAYEIELPKDWLEPLSRLIPILFKEGE